MLINKKMKPIVYSLLLEAEIPSSDWNNDLFKDLLLHAEEAAKDDFKWMTLVSSLSNKYKKTLETSQ